MNGEITFDDFDKFQRKDFADRLTTVISTFYPFHDEVFVLSLNAKFGNGKTTFLKMWQHQLEQTGYQTIFINAWETDFDDEPRRSYNASSIPGSLRLCQSCKKCILSINSRSWGGRPFSPL
jgi:hypothetical protein